MFIQTKDTKNNCLLIRLCRSQNSLILLEWNRWVSGGFSVHLGSWPPACPKWRRRDQSGIEIDESLRLVRLYTGRVLKGEKPGDLPVVQPTRYVLAINRKTAKALGIEVPPGLLAIADGVID